MDPNGPDSNRARLDDEPWTEGGPGYQPWVEPDPDSFLVTDQIERLVDKIDRLVDILSTVTMNRSMPETEPIENNSVQIDRGTLLWMILFLGVFLGMAVQQLFHRLFPVFIP